MKTLQNKKTDIPSKVDENGKAKEHYDYAGLVKLMATQAPVDGGGNAADVDEMRKRFRLAEIATDSNKVLTFEDADADNLWALVQRWRWSTTVADKRGPLDFYDDVKQMAETKPEKESKGK